MAIMLNIHTKSHTVRGRPTLKLVEHFGNRLVRELYERSIYKWSFTSELSIEKYQAKPAISNNHLILCLHVNTTVYLDVIKNSIENQKLLWNISEEKAENWRNLFMSVFIQAYWSPLGYVVMWRLEELQRMFVSLIWRG